MTEHEFGTFFLPGPTEVRQEVLQAMTRPMLPHRGSVFERLYQRCDEGLRPVFRTERPVYLASSSATGLMEGSIRCTPPGPILALVNGAFSERYAQVARAAGREVHEYPVPLGAVHEPAEVGRRLLSSGAVAVTLAHSETSTGALNDVQAIANVTHASGARILVDSVTGLAGAPLETHAWGLDFVFTGSQKALALPPGLAFGVASAAFIAAAAALPNRGTYFDLVEFEKYAVKHQTPNTPAISLLFALERQVEWLAAEGIEARWARHAAMQSLTAEWVGELAGTLDPAIGILAPAGSRSPTVTCITLPAGITGGTVVREVSARGYVIGAGYGALKDTTIRIGHMGDHTLDGLSRCLVAVRDALASLVAAGRKG